MFERDPKVASVFRKAIEGSILVDLGTGPGSKFVNLLRNVIYVSVDKFPLRGYQGGDEVRTRRVYEWKSESGEGMVKSIDVQADMLAFISKPLCTSSAQWFRKAA